MNKTNNQSKKCLACPKQATNQIFCRSYFFYLCKTHEDKLEKKVGEIKPLTILCSEITEPNTF